jgi:hypothetical protein
MDARIKLRMTPSLPECCGNTALAVKKQQASKTIRAPVFDRGPLFQ